MKPELIIIRGIPGSGKSTFAQVMLKHTGYPVCEADDYFMRSGEYVFAGEKVAAAHAWCLRKIRWALSNRSGAISSNCDFRWKDLKHVLGVGRELDANVRIIDMLAQFGSVHAVPEEKMKKIVQGFARFPDLIPFYLRDKFDPAMIRSYDVVFAGGEMYGVPLDFNVKAAPPV